MSFFCLALALSSLSWAQGQPLEPNDAPYDASSQRLDDKDFLLLSQEGYRIEGGALYAPLSKEPVGREELYFVLESLRSRRRLTALLEIDILLNRGGGKPSGPEDREALRRIGREYWCILGRSTRNELRPYFNRDEIAAMDKSGAIGPPPRAASLPPPPPEPHAPAPAADETAPARKAPEQAPPPPPAPAESAGAPAVYKGPGPFDPSAFAAFLEGAAIGRDVKPLLESIAAHAREPERTLALGLAREVSPHVVLDSARAAERPRSVSCPPEPATLQPGGCRIALSDGPVLLRRRGLFGSRTFRVPDSPEFFKSRGLAAPGAEAFRREAASEREEARGLDRVRVYEDGSLRLRWTSDRLAGDLLAALLDADAQLRGWKADAFARLRSEAARNRFFLAIEKDAGGPAALDGESAASLREWRERPDDWADLVLQASSAGGREGEAAARLMAEIGWPVPAPAAKAAPPPPAGVQALAVESPKALEGWLEIERLAREEK